MSRFIRALCVAVSVATALAAMAACAPAKSGAKVTLRLGHVNSASDPWQKTAEEFADKVSKATNGAVEVEVYPGSQLGGDRELVEGMKIGSVDMAMVAGVLSSVEPSMTMLELPYLFDSVEDMRAALDGKGGQQLSDALGKQGIRNLAWLDRGPRELTANRPITTPAELKGAKIRVPEIPASIDAWRAMGANPTPMAFSEVYGALQQGVIDGQENPYAIIDSAKLPEVQSHVMQTDHVFGYVMLALSDQAWQKLSKDQQDAVLKVAGEVRESHNTRTASDEKDLRTKLEKAGMTFVDVDRQAFKDAVRGVHEQYAEKYGKDLYDALTAGS